MLQDELKARARRLVIASQKRDHAAIADEFGALARSCVSCHQVFLEGPRSDLTHGDKTMNLDETYARALERHPVMAAAEQAEVAARYARTRDPRDAERLVLGNLRLVVKIARELGGPSVAT